MRYLITLEPMDVFFFGGEKTFNSGGGTEYFAKSTPCPQQTTLLGMLRKEILIVTGLFKSNFKYSSEERKNMEKAIGRSGFVVGRDNDYGVVKGISPLFLMKDGKAYFHVPMGGNTELEPYGESETIVIEIKNPNRVRLYPPVLRARGVRRTASQDYQDALQDSLDEEVRPPPETPQSLYHLQALLDH